MEVYNYFVTDPCLRNDYNYLWNYVQMIKFSVADDKEMTITPFDSKQLEKKVLKIEPLPIPIEVDEPK